jgi:hypothetical protein
MARHLVNQVLLHVLLHVNMVLLAVILVPSFAHLLFVLLIFVNATNSHPLIGLYGANNLEAIAIDGIIEALLDTRKNFVAARTIKDNETEKKAKVEAYFKDEWPVWAAKINAQLAANNEGKGWIVGNKV